jgi:hypothetical protein
VRPAIAARPKLPKSGAITKGVWDIVGRSYPHGAAQNRRGIG